MTGIDSRWRVVCTTLLICGSASLLLTCQSKQTFVPTNTRPEVTATRIPPFSTREPERYQAVRTISVTEGFTNSVISRTLIARDGTRRREEFEPKPGQTIVYLEMPKGRFVLLPAAKLFADLDVGSSEAPQGELSPDLSTERLLNQIPVESRYEKIGAESINGRATTKYSVVPADRTNSTAGNAETLIWIDDVLRMPLMWQITETSSGKQTKTIMELSNVTMNVDPQIFGLPTGYRKVDIGVLKRVKSTAGRPQSTGEEKR